MEDALGLKVQFKDRAGRGEISIRYSSPEEAQMVVNRLTATYFGIGPQDLEAGRTPPEANGERWATDDDDLRKSDIILPPEEEWEDDDDWENIELSEADKKLLDWDRLRQHLKGEGKGEEE